MSSTPLFIAVLLVVGASSGPLEDFKGMVVNMTF